MYDTENPYSYRKLMFVINVLTVYIGDAIGYRLAALINKYMFGGYTVCNNFSFNT